MNQEFEFNSGAISPIQCLSDACVLLKGYYGNFLGIMFIAFLMILISSCLPFMPLLAPIICGIYLCMFAAMERKPFNTSTLFKGFEFFGQSFLGFLVLSVPLGILSGILQIGLSAMNSPVNSNTQIEEDIRILLYEFSFIFGMLFLIYAASLIIGTLTAFVYPLIVDRKLKALQALKLSFRAVMSNFFGVVGLIIWGQIIMFAGLWLCYFGALLVAPVVFGAWTIAYRRVFPLLLSTSASANEPLQRQTLWWTPPETASRAGWYLVFASILILGFVGIGTAVLGSAAYKAVLTNIKAEETENRGVRSKEKMTEDNTRQVKPRRERGNSSTPTQEKAISRGVLNSSAVKLPKPTYPQSAKAVRAGGAVNVQVTVDEEGKVISVTAVSGHPMLRASAEQAARNAEFKPTILSGKAVKTTGLIVYDFNP